jgi:hypothetical protein
MFRTLKQWPLIATWSRHAGTVITWLLLTLLLVSIKPLHAVDAPRSTTPEVWFNLIGYKNPVGRVSWDTLFFRPDAAWPELSLAN